MVLLFNASVAARRRRIGRGLYGKAAAERKPVNLVSLIIAATIEAESGYRLPRTWSQLTRVMPLSSQQHHYEMVTNP